MFTLIAQYWLCTGMDLRVIYLSRFTYLTIKLK